MRVVSLLPSATELLVGVGGQDLLVGRSHECDWPVEITDRPILTSQRTTGSTGAAIDEEVRRLLKEGQPLYELDETQLADLKPDLILTQDLCSVCSIDLAAVSRVASRLSPQPQVMSLNPTSLDDVYDDALRIGSAIGCPTQADQAVVNWRATYHNARDYVNCYEQGPVVAFLEWHDPIMAAGHWTPALIEAAGGQHPYNPPGANAITISTEELKAACPDRLIVCPCGLDLEAIRQQLDVLTTTEWWSDIPAVKNNQVAIVDGNQMFNRPGPRLIDAFCWLVGWLQERPEVIPNNFPWQPVVHDTTIENKYNRTPLQR